MSNLVLFLLLNICSWGSKCIKSPNCQPPTQALLKQIATNIISKDPRNAIWYPLALKNAKLTQFDLIKDKFSGKGKEDLLERYENHVTRYYDAFGR
jgi:hypothetical protein